MRDYLYDGTFEGLLTCIYHHYYTDKAAGIYPQGEYQPSMLNGFMEVETDEEKAARVYNAIGNKISGYSLRLIYRAYLSGITGKENVILSYVLFGFRVGPSVGSLHARPEVRALEEIVREVGNERERRGLPMNPDIRFCNVVECALAACDITVEFLDGFDVLKTFLFHGIAPMLVLFDMP